MWGAVRAILGAVNLYTKFEYPNALLYVDDFCDFLKNSKFRSYKDNIFETLNNVVG